jgi:hypothetical protein
VWGLGPSGPHGVGVLRAYVLTGDERYRTAMVRASSFTLGANPLNQSFVTGVGANPPRYPLVVDAVNGGEPVAPGLVEFGIHDLGYLSTDTWVDHVLANARTTPSAHDVPLLWSWYDVSSIPMMNEFIVHDTTASALWTFGVLAGAASVEGQ